LLRWLTVALLLSGTLPARERAVAITYQVTVPTNAPLHLWLPVPHSDAYQTISNLEFQSPSPYGIATDTAGNQIFHTVTKAAGAITMSFQAVRRERLLTATPAKDPHCCLHPDRLVPINGNIAKWANEVAGAQPTQTEKARAIYEHIIATVKYDKSGKGWGRGDIYYACDARRGNCTDFHAIFIGYSRALGIPARFAIGLPLPPGKTSGEIAGYHCWAEFWSPESGWTAIDASEAAKDPARRNYFFGAHDEHRVEFTQGRDLNLIPRQQGEPLNYFIYPYAEQNGQPFPGLQTKITFRSEPPSTPRTR
jgi:transglutaminase-like putative cysteine protease